MRITIPTLLAIMIALAAGANGGAAGSACGVSLTGGTAAERAVAQRVVCHMPGTPIESIQVNEQPPDAPSDTLWLSITLPRPAGQSFAGFVGEIRGKWDAGIAAGAIRDAFIRAGLRRVVGYEERFPGVQPDPNYLYGIALPSWGIRRWTTGAPSRNLGKRADRWPVLQAKLNALSLRYHVKTRLVRYEPLGKAPLVVVSSPTPARFLAAGGFQAYERVLHYHEARYDGIFLELVTPTKSAAVLVFATYRTRWSEGCGMWHRIRGASKVCASQ